VLGELRRVDTDRGIVLAPALDGEVAVEPAQGHELAPDRGRLIAALCGKVEDERLDVGALGRHQIATQKRREEFQVARVRLAGPCPAAACVVQFRDKRRDRRVLGQVDRLVGPPASLPFRRLPSHSPKTSLPNSYILES
jgi:hypothetical protein